MIISGLTTFKGKEYCKAEYTANSNGNSVHTIYYFTEDSKDVWVQTTVNGQTSEVHVTG